MSTVDKVEKEAIRLNLEGSEARKLAWLRRKRGLKMNTELLRLLINEEYERQGGSFDLDLPRFEQVNCDENGVKILDRQLHQVADVFFRREGVKCVLDESDDCEHITFALSLPNVKKTIQKHKKEGWNLPL
jgi:hypothetical protein